MAWVLVDNIRGPKGDKGDTGSISEVSVATLPPGSAATVEKTGTSDVHVHFGIPKGDKGDQGVPGTLSSASAESVSAGSNAQVIMSGTTEVKHAHFKIPRGLPGVNAVDNDEAVATYVGAEDSETQAALNLRYRTGLSVTAFGAVGDGTTDDTVAILAAIEAARPDRRTVYFPTGLYIVSDTLPLYSNVKYRGDGPGASRIRLAAGSDVDLLRTVDFDTLTGTTSQSGPDRFVLEGLTFDGNGTHQSDESWTFRAFARAYTVTDVEFINGRDGNVFSEWGTGGLDMESMWTNVRVSGAVAGPGIDWRGPHDSTFTNMFVYKNGEATSNYDGITTSGNAGGEIFTNTHVWGGHRNGWNLRKMATAAGCVSEGARDANVLIAASRVMWDGHIYGRSSGDSATEVGLQIGDATSGAVTAYYASVMMFNFLNAATKPISFVQDSGGQIVGTVNKGTPANVVNGSYIHPRTQLMLSYPDGSADSVARIGSVRLNGTGVPLQVLVNDVNRMRITGTVAQFGNQTDLRGYTDDYTTETWRIHSNWGYFRPAVYVTGSLPNAATAGAGAMVYNSTIGMPVFSNGSAWRRADGSAI